MRYCSLSSGSRGNSSVFSARSTHILIDAGLSCKRLTEGIGSVGLTPEDISGILITHEHIDHVKGLKLFAEKNVVPIYMNAGTFNAIQGLGIDQRLIRLFRTGEDFMINDLCVNPIRTSHDAAESVGYCIECGNRRFSFFTDLGYLTKSIVSYAKTSEFVVLEANHDIEMLKRGRYPQMLKNRVLGKRGHLSNTDCAAAAVELAKNGVAQIVLAHMSDENNTPELARATVINCLTDAGIREGKDFLVGLAMQNMISPIYEMG